MAMLKGLLAAVLSLAATGAASGAGAYPDKPVRLYVGFAPGGATDLLARLYAKKLGEKFNQTFIVENRPGAGGNIAVQALAQAPADGYTIAMAANYVAANAAMQRNPYDWERDLMPIGMVASTPNILVVPAASRLNGVADLVREARKSPGKLTFGSAGMGSSIHLAGELFKVMAGVDMTRALQGRVAGRGGSGLGHRRHDVRQRFHGHSAGAVGQAQGAGRDRARTDEGHAGPAHHRGGRAERL